MQQTGPILVLSGSGRALGAADPLLRRRLARSALSAGAPPEPLLAVLAALGLPPPAAGLGALRLWGQTGEPPRGFVAAADPVYLEPYRDRLSLHPLPDVAEAELDLLFAELEAALAADRRWAFRRLGRLSYFCSAEPVATARVPAQRVRGEVLPLPEAAGALAAAHDRLQSELQMCLHLSPVNRRREAEGLPPVNGLWLWGGGEAVAAAAEALPRLYGEEPLVRGYWLSAGGTAAPWAGGPAACFDAADGGAFVGLVPAGEEEAALRELFGMLDSRRLRHASVVFADGLRAEVGARDRLRFWRHSHPLLDDDPS